uniref:BLTX561 n=1 Tax=Nephila pilipes TaxID=299642 RepID=A0A076KZW6_NEPPI|nr:BLTX561 [Nephila pilipes]
MKFCILLVAVLVLGTEAYRKGGWRRPRCEYVKCDENCRKVKDDEGCFKCECKPLCSPPKCEPGCVIQEKFDGPCPGCDCPDEIIDIVEKKVIVSHLIAVPVVK